MREVSLSNWLHYSNSSFCVRLLATRSPHNCSHPTQDVMAKKSAMHYPPWGRRNVWRWCLCKSLQYVTPTGRPTMYVHPDSLDVSPKLSQPFRTVHYADTLPWTLVDLVCAVTVTSLPAVYNLLTAYLPKSISQHWTSHESRNAANYLSTNKSNIGKSKGSTMDEEQRKITVRRDIDLESMRTENSENLDPGFLELNDMQRSNTCYVSA